GASRHRHGRSRMVCQHEDGYVIRRLVAPPTLPPVIGPRAPDRTEHVAPDDPRPESGQPSFRDVIVDARLTVGESVHLPPASSVKKPVHQIRAVDAERILQILTGSGTEAIN